MQLQGKIIKKFETVVLNKRLQKSQLLLKTSEKYPKEVIVDFFNENSDLINKYNINDNIIIEIDINSLEYKDKYYTSVIGCNISHDIL